jgi:hypothetical protein
MWIILGLKLRSSGVMLLKKWKQLSCYVVVIMFVGFMFLSVLLAIADRLLLEFGCYTFIRIFTYIYCFASSFSHMVHRTYISFYLIIAISGCFSCKVCVA